MWTTVSTAPLKKISKNIIYEFIYNRDINLIRILVQRCNSLGEFKNKLFRLKLVPQNVY